MYGAAGAAWGANGRPHVLLSTLRNELVRHRQCQDQAEARQAIFEYSEGFYNRQRLHQELGYRSPGELEQQARDS